MIAWLDLAARREAEVVTSPMTLVEAYDGRTTEQRRDRVLSRLKVVEIGKDEARQARRLLAEEIVAGWAKRLPYSDVRQLAHAIDTGEPVTVEYVATSGDRTTRTLSRLMLDPPHPEA